MHGATTVVNLGVPIRGEPPPSKRVGDRGDREFEQSRKEALKALAVRQGEVRAERISKAEGMRNYRAATGHRLGKHPIGSLSKVFNGENPALRRKTWHGQAHHHVSLFVSWATAEKIHDLLDVTTSHAKEFIHSFYNEKHQKYTVGTVRRIKMGVAMAFDHALPEGAPNPFRHATLIVDAVEGDKQFHREPLTPTEVERLLVVAKDEDTEAYGWIVCALSTGLRRGDVCRLKWENVDLGRNTLCVQTSKTKVDLYLPILKLFRSVLEDRKATADGKSPYVFPEAERLMGNLRGQEVTRRVKRLFALALGAQDGARRQECRRIAEVTRQKRTVGMMSASKYDFHALRTTFVTLAISAGIGIEKLKALTGHATVDVAMRQYYKK